MFDQAYKFSYSLDVWGSKCKSKASADDMFDGTVVEKEKRIPSWIVSGSFIM